MTVWPIDVNSRRSKFVFVFLFLSSQPSSLCHIDFTGQLPEIHCFFFGGGGGGEREGDQGCLKSTGERG